jgi:hypothetical protein
MEQLRLYALLVQPHVLLGWTLLQLNPEAAHAFVGDAEMDAATTGSTTRAGPAPTAAAPRPARPCTASASTPTGFPSRPPPAPSPTRGRRWRAYTPAPVIKGSCDYPSWAYGMDYRQALPNARLI